MEVHDTYQAGECAFDKLSFSALLSNRLAFHQVRVTGLVSNPCETAETLRHCRLTQDHCGLDEDCPAMSCRGNACLFDTSTSRRA